jgi:ferrous iron transport protein B
MSDRRTIALVGNPNCGKTTLFNAFTGTDQRVGNWPGVTVERKEGHVKLESGKVSLVDLPGIYALLASSEDERVARDYILSGEPGLVVDIVDATNLERNLFLTTQLLDMGVPVVVVLNMMDLAEARGIAVDAGRLSRRLGCPVIPMTATDRRTARTALHAVDRAWRERKAPAVRVPQPPAVERLAEEWAERLSYVAAGLGTDPRWLTLKILERDAWAIDKVVATGAMSAADIESDTVALEDELDESADIVLAEARYTFIEAAVADSVKRPPARDTASDKADRVFLNRYLGIPIFLGVMYLLFWFTINVGGAFIDFFDIIGGTVFVDGLSELLTSIGSPEWLTTILAGVGAGVQTVLTFIPVIFAMFLGLSLLEDSGYMARAAFVMDRFMRWVGLPGKSFVPLLVGFGCNVPAIMATRTLENKRDRYLTVFMNPLMSCGARLPVYALFGAAFFGAAAGAMTFSLYVVGIVVAVLTGLLLKRTLFKGEATYFVMELPPYHAPRVRNVLRTSWRRLSVFMTRAAMFIIPIVAVLAILNSVGTDGTFGNEDSDKSVLSSIGKTITPVFEPMGLEEDNWPATVGIFTGIFAKEAVVGTLNSLYEQEGAAAAADEGAAEEESFAFWAGIKDAFVSIPDALAGVPATLVDPLGVTAVSGSQDEVAEEVGASSSVYAALQAGFSQGASQAYAYLLFILLYPPCVAAFGAMAREIGARYALVSSLYLLVVAWAVATLFYQFALGGSTLWIGVSFVLILLMIFMFWAMGRRSTRLPGRALDVAEGTTARC